MDVNNITLKEFAELVYKMMYGPSRKDLISAYSAVHAIYNNDYSYEEVKDFLFHNDLEYVLKH